MPSTPLISAVGTSTGTVVRSFYTAHDYQLFVTILGKRTFYFQEQEENLQLTKIKKNTNTLIRLVSWPDICLENFNFIFPYIELVSINVRYFLHHITKRLPVPLKVKPFVWLVC